MNDIEEMDAKKVKEIKQIFNDLFSELNHMGNEGNVQDALKEVLGEQHRTLQQNFFRYVVVPAILAFADKHSKGLTDLRNEASCELADKLRSIVKDAPLPFI
jgi:hypothetical protein